MLIFPSAVVFGTGPPPGSGLPGSAHPGHHGADDSRRPEELPPLPSTKGGTSRPEPELPLCFGCFLLQFKSFVKVDLLTTSQGSSFYAGLYLVELNVNQDNFESLSHNGALQCSAIKQTTHWSLKLLPPGSSSTHWTLFFSYQMLHCGAQFLKRLHKEPKLTSYDTAPPIGSLCPPCVCSSSGPVCPSRHWRKCFRWPDRSQTAWPTSTPTSLCIETWQPETAWWPRISLSK